MDNQSNELEQYFSSFKKWYAFKYIYPYTQKAYIIISLIFSTLCLFILFQIYNLQYKKVNLPIPLYVNDNSYFPYIKSIGNSLENPNISIARYFLSKYIVLRESYSYKILNENKWYEILETLKHLSSRKVFSEYIKYINIETNPNSPILKYKLQTTKSINIESIQFPKNTNRPNHALVKFESLEYNRATEETTKQLFFAEVYFDINDIQYIYKNKMPLEFNVTRYKVYKIQ